MVSAMLTQKVPHPVEALVFGGSAGAIRALLYLLPPLSAVTTVPIITVVHLPPRRPSLLPEVFSERCALPVREPCDKEPVVRGIWFAPSDYHLLIEKDRAFSLSLDEPHLHSRPSIDALFESAADCYGPALVGAILTGASRDGARGARTIGHHGGLCFALITDEAGDFSTMPRAAIEEGATPASLEELAGALLLLCKHQQPEGIYVEKHS
jgi:two-component system chemotaxis response regulator CheB